MLRGWTCLLQRAQKRKIYFYLLVFGTSFLNQKNLHPHLSYPTKLVANGSSEFTQAYQGGCVRGCTSERTPPHTHTHTELLGNMLLNWGATAPSRYLRPLGLNKLGFRRAVCKLLVDKLVGFLEP